MAGSDQVSYRSGDPSNATYNDGSSHAEQDHILQPEARKQKLLQSLTDTAKYIAPFVQSYSSESLFNSWIVSFIYDFEDLESLLSPDEYSNTWTSVLQSAHVSETQWSSWKATWGAPRERISLEEIEQWAAQEKDMLTLCQQ